MRFIANATLQILLIALSMIPVLAQSATATLTGTVTDETGAVVAGATVVVTDLSKQVERQTTTNSDGFFIVPQLLPSRYKIRVQRTGFATAELPDVALNVGDQSSLRVQLKVAQVGETVTITEASLVSEASVMVTVSRPNLVAGQPLYLNDPPFAGGRRFNPAAFDGVTPIAQGRQGTLGRNVLRGFSANQVDVALRRDFKLVESLNLQFRLDAFNLFNHANFANPTGILTSAIFGRATQMLSSGLGGLSPLYQIGGLRSLQLALKLQF